MGTVRQRVILVVERDGRRLMAMAQALLSAGFWVVEARTPAIAQRELEGGLTPRAVVVSRAGASNGAEVRERLVALAVERGAKWIEADRPHEVVARVRAELDVAPPAARNAG